jgi:hypothetical protein
MESDMKAPTRRIGFALAAFLLTAALSCSSAPPAPAVQPPAADTQPIPPQPAPPPATPAPAPQTEALEPEPPVQPEPAMEEAIHPAELAEAVKQEELPPEEEPFDPTTITKEVFDTTKTDVQKLIERLNTIIRDKDYESWVTFLGPRYRAALSDNSFLERISASTILRKQQIILRELRDYFIYVVVPSRANDRVDDIEFIGQNRVKAFTLDAKGRRLRLYDLEKTPTGWQIIN